MHHVNHGQKTDSEQNVHCRSGNRDNEPMPARVRKEFRGIAAAGIHRILAAHLYITTERNRRDAVIGFAVTESQKPLAKSDGKLLRPGLRATWRWRNGQIHESES